MFLATNLQTYKHCCKVSRNIYLNGCRKLDIVKSAHKQKSVVSIGSCCVVSSALDESYVVVVVICIVAINHVINKWTGAVDNGCNWYHMQNGSLVDGLQLWKRNVDKHFEGVDECYICYSVLHGSSYQLPRKQCRTCRKRFHAECLYRWFDTSNNSACPLCRNLF